MVDPWMDKAWRMQRETECLSNVSILKAALSLEKKQNEAPDYDTQRSFRFITSLSGARTEKKREGAAYSA